MEIRDLRVYIAVVEAQGFTAASHRLHMVQSSVSDVVARLERELGITLLERRGGTRPTAAGEALLRWARLLANCSERAVREVRSFQMLEPTSMRVGMLPTITPLVLPGFLGNLRVRYPRLSVTVQEALAPELLERVRLAELDVAVVFFPVEAAPDIVLVPVAARPLRVMVNASHPFGGRRTVGLAELADDGWVTYPAGNPGRLWLEEACRMADFAPRVTAEVETPTQQRIFVEAGAGIAMVPLLGPPNTPNGAPSATLDLEPPLPQFRIGYAYAAQFVDPAVTAAGAALDAVLAHL